MGSSRKLVRARLTRIKTQAQGMKVMLGCVTETSCAVSAAAQLSPLMDRADLDGNLLIATDVFRGIRIVDGKVMVPQSPGVGVEPLEGLPAFKN